MYAIRSYYAFSAGWGGMALIDDINRGVLDRFLEAFHSHSRKLGRRQTVVPYFISGHPGCTLADMVEVALFLKRHSLQVEQVQEFSPTPGSLATCIWHTGRDPFSGAAVYVAKSP